MNFPSKSSWSRYTSCDKHSTHRGERARRSCTIFDLRAICLILGRKSVICAILAGVVRKSEKIKSTTVFFSSQKQVCGNVFHAFTESRSDAVDSSVCDKIGQVMVRKNTYLTQSSRFERIIPNNTSDYEKYLL